MKTAPIGITTLIAFLFNVMVESAELQSRTIEAFNQYVRATETGMSGGAFLWVDTLPEPQKRARLEELQRGGLLIERLTTRDRGRDIRIPDGLVHHWVGAVFVPGATVDQALALLQDYNRHAEIYAPAVQRSKLLGRDGDVFRVYLRFYQKKVLTVIVNSEHEARFVRPAPDRAQSRIYSTRIAEVEDANTPRERELPVGIDGGYLWRLDSYWRFLERDGGTYVQSESISLTRGIPFVFAPVIRPFVTSVPRESLEFTLTTTRRTLLRQ
jgi:hypothetical protein